MSYTNPSIAEIREWAYTTAPWPIEEWDLFLSWTGEIDLFIELATDHACLQKLFFLHMLYTPSESNSETLAVKTPCPALPGTPIKVDRSGTGT